MYYINYFFIFSIIGHLIETILFPNGESGILFGYWTPIYGTGAIIILLINKFLKKLNLNKFLKGILLFFFSALILSAIEVLGGYLIKWIFNKELWDYSSHKFNVGKYTSLEMACVWGASSILLIYILKPLIDKFINKIPKMISYILSILFIVDIVISIIIK